MSSAIQWKRHEQQQAATRINSSGSSAHRSVVEVLLPSSLKGDGVVSSKRRRIVSNVLRFTTIVVLAFCLGSVLNSNHTLSSVVVPTRVLTTVAATSIETTTTVSTNNNDTTNVENKDDDVEADQQEHDTSEFGWTSSNVSTSGYLEDVQWKDECTIYLAPSSIKGNVNGFGLYTATNMTKGQAFLASYDAPSIAVLDTLPWQHEEKESALLHTQRKEWLRLFKNYWWARGLPYQIRLEAESSIDYQATFGTFPNHHCILSSMQYTFKPINYDDTLVGPGDPGMGAFSYHNGRHAHTKRDLQAGSEILINYGYCHRERLERYPPWAQPLPMQEDFEEAAIISLELWKQVLIRQIQAIASTTTTSEAKVDDLFPTYKAVASNPHVERMIPSNMVELEKIMKDYKDDDEKKNKDVASSKKEDNDNDEVSYEDEDDYSTDDDDNVLSVDTELVERLTRVKGMNERTPEWVRKNGLCMEKMITQKSTIPHAGRGGFLQIPVSAGEQIVPAPTLHILNRDLLNMDRDGNTNNTQQQQQQQLLLNYCFGHEHSSLLLCPNTNAMLINHCSTRNPKHHCGNGNNNGPNAKVQWASSPTWFKSTTDAWLKMSLEEIAKQPGRGIAMEVVALRDIARGEEITIDYGEAWEKAWEQHLATWAYTPNDNPGYMSATMANLKKDKLLPMIVSNDLRKRKRHSNLFCGCYYERSAQDNKPAFRQQGLAELWQNYTDRSILFRYADDGSDYVLSYAEHKDRSYWPCTMIKQDDDGNNNNGTTTFTVRIYPSKLTDSKPSWARNGLPRFLTNYPIESIHIFHKPYKSHQHLPGTFRHYIGLPDEMMPSQWKNLLT